MASSYFNFSKTGGTGGYLAEEVVVTPVAANTTSGDNVTIATVQGGGGSKTVRITHFGVPSIHLTNGDPSVPATGATLSYTIDTHYPFCFKNVPAYVTISDSNGQTYAADTQYAASLASNTTFYITVGANTGTTTRDSGTFYMGHYYNGTLSSTYTAPIAFSQAAGASEYLSISPVTNVWDWDDTSADTKTITVSANVPWTAASTNGSFEIVGASTGSGNGSITVRVKDINPSSSDRKSGGITFTSTSLSQSATLTQYRQPRLVYNGVVSLGRIEVDPTGGTLSMEFESDYNWWFYPSLSTVYITMKDQDNNPLTPPSSSSPYAGATGTTYYRFTWTENTGNIRNDTLAASYTRLDGTTGTVYSNFSLIRQQYVVVPSISVEPSNLIFDWWDSGVTRSIQVSTNQSSWDYAVDHNFEGHFNVVKDGNYLRITPTGNHSQDTMGVALWYANFNFTAGTATTTATTTQYRKPSVNIATGQDRGIPASGGTREVVITSDYDWWLVTQFETDSYLTVEKSGNEVDIFDYTNPYGPVSVESFDMVFSANPTTSPRPYNGESCFEVRYYDRSGNMRTDGGSDCGWKQSGATQPVIQHFIKVNPTAFTTDFSQSINNQTTVSASTDWSIGSRDNWVTYRKNFSSTSEVVTSGTSGNTTLWVKVDANTGDSRSAVTFFQLENTPLIINTKQIISQESGILPVEDYIELSSTGATIGSGSNQSQYITVTANTNWTLSRDVDWYNWYSSLFGNTVVTGGTSGVTTIYRRVQANSQYSNRTGTTTFTAGEAEADYTLIQQAARASWDADPDIFSVPSEGGTYNVTLTAEGPWYASTTYSWIQQASLWYGDSPGSYILSFSVDYNSQYGSDRSGFISIYNTDTGVEVLQISIDQDMP